MRKSMVFAISLLCVLVGVVATYAADTDKWNLGSTSWSVDTNNVLTPGSASGQKAVYELFTTGDTLTARETGKKCILDHGQTGQPAVFTLPAAAVGVEFTIIDGCGSNYIHVDPDGTDSIVYLTLDAGDRLIGPSSTATGDSVSLVCPVAGSWYIESMKGTWRDGGA